MLPASAHVDPRSRMRNIVGRALNGAAYEASRSEEGGRLVIDARRPDGAAVHVRFLGVQDSESTAVPEPGASLRLLGIGSAEKFSLLRILRPRFPPRAFMGEVRVTIEVGAARIEIVCQDAEWWEEGPRAPGEG